MSKALVQSAVIGHPAVNPRADVNCDGRVNDADLLIVLVTQGRSCQ